MDGGVDGEVGSWAPVPAQAPFSLTRSLGARSRPSSPPPTTTACRTGFPLQIRNMCSARDRSTACVIYEDMSCSRRNTISITNHYQ